METMINRAELRPMIPAYSYALGVPSDVRIRPQGSATGIGIGAVPTRATTDSL